MSVRNSVTKNTFVCDVYHKYLWTKFVFKFVNKNYQYRLVGYTRLPAIWKIWSWNMGHFLLNVMSEAPRTPVHIDL